MEAEARVREAPIEVLEDEAVSAVTAEDARASSSTAATVSWGNCCD
jgi:hypothetical protein